jgi:hypothetical protein
MADPITSTPDAAIAPVIPAAPDVQPAVPAAPDVTAPVAGGAAGVAPTGPPLPPKQSFVEGMQPKSYTTDAQGNIINAAPARTPSVKGVLGGTLMGALTGAARGAAAQAPEGARGKGAAFSAGAAAAEKGKIAADTRARAVAQQDFENKQKAVEERSIQSMRNASQLALVQKTEHEGMLFPEQMKQAHLTNEHLAAQAQLAELQVAHSINEQKQMTDGLLSFMSSQGFDTTKLTHATAAGVLATPAGAEGAPIEGVAKKPGELAKSSMWQQLHPMAPQIGGGTATIIHTGGKGDDNGIAITTPQDLKNFPLTADYHYPVYSGVIDPKTGMPQKSQTGGVVAAKDATGKPTGATMYDAYLAMQGGVDQLDRMQKQIAQGLQNQHVRAETVKAGAEAELAEAKVKMMKDTQLTLPEGFKTPEAAFHMNADDLGRALQAQGVQLPADFNNIYALGHYKAKPEDYPQRVTQGTGQIDRKTAMSRARAFVNPNLDEMNYGAIQKMVTSFADPKQGTAGGNVVAYNTAASHLEQLYNLTQAVKQRDIKAINAVQQAYGVETGTNDYKPVFNAIRDALTGELGKTFKGAAADIEERRAIEKNVSADMAPQLVQGWAKQSAALMLSKSQALIGQYYGYTGELPPNALDPHTVQVYKNLGIDPYHGLPEGARVSVGGTGNVNPAQPGVSQRTVKVGGQDVAVDANGMANVGGHQYKLGADGRTFTLVQPGPTSTAR